MGLAPVSAAQDRAGAPPAGEVGQPHRRLPEPYVMGNVLQPSVRCPVGEGEPRVDLVTHALTGGALAGTGLRRLAKGATAVLVLSSVAPDVDVAAYLWDPYTALAFRRGWTHGPLAVLAIPPLVTAGVVWALRRRRRAGGDADKGRPALAPLLGLAYFSFVLHVLMDWLNTYGVRFWVPFSPRWSYGDSVFILDPWLWGLLGGAWVVGRRGREGMARFLVVTALLYVGAMVGSRFAARDQVAREARGAGWAVEEVMVGPRPANPFVRDVVVRTPEGYRVGRWSWWDRPRLQWLEGGVRPRVAVEGDLGETVETVLARARQEPAVARYLVWSRFPLYRVRSLPEGGVEVAVGDARYTGLPGRGGGLGGVTVRLAAP